MSSDGQLSFFFGETKSPEIKIDPEPEPEVAPRPPTPSKYPLNSEQVLRDLVAAGEYMLFLYGQNENVCFLRTHSSEDDGTEYPLMRKDALAIIGDRYIHQSNYANGTRRAKVYVRKKRGASHDPESIAEMDH